MILYPAIDLKGGACVRLEQGAMHRATVFSDDPAKTACGFNAIGFSWLHVVDLDGAFAGESRNGAAVDAILAATDAKVQLGGGIRSMAAIEAWLDKGVHRVILGTAAAKDPALVLQACRAFPGRVAVGIDARDGQVAVAGWADTTTLTVTTLAAKFEDAGAAAIIHTDISRDGMLTGLNLVASSALARSVSTPVIASGGFSGMDDIARLAGSDGAGLAGAVVGRALYDGRLDPGAALSALAEAAC